MQEGQTLGKRTRLVKKSPMPANRSDLYAFLDARGIAWRTVDHPPVFTVEQGRGFKANMPGGHSKNLFLKDKKDRLYLVTAHSDTAVDLVGLGKAIGSAGRLSFGRPDLMTATLGVEPGSVTPFSLINQSARALTGFVLDVALMRHPLAWFHPLSNDASTGVAPEGLLDFVRACGFEPRLVDLSAPLGHQAGSVKHAL
jgi:Ala-tRNA(Pro) deacylase